MKKSNIFRIIPVIVFGMGICGVGVVNAQIFKHETAAMGLECQAVNRELDCGRCKAKGEYGEVGTVEIQCDKCAGVSNVILSRLPCSKCSNSRKVRNSGYVPPTKCEVCNGRGKLFNLGHKFQVADADYTEALDWHDAKYVCSNFGGGWRLPTKEELKGMYEFLHRKGKGDFSDKFYYWSSSEYNAKFAYYFGFFNGQDGWNDGEHKYHNYQVRAVRDF